MNINPECPVCIPDCEDGVHHFFKCKPVNKPWRACDLAQMEEMMIIDQPSYEWSVFEATERGCLKDSEVSVLLLPCCGLGGVKDTE
jgi:hypothetical protein